MDCEQLQRVIAALILRCSCGHCHFGANELESAPIKTLQFVQSKSGDLWVTLDAFFEHDTELED